MLKKHFSYTSVSLNKRDKPFHPPNNLGGPVGNWGFWVGGIKVTENTKQPRGTLWECGVLGGEHRLNKHENYLNIKTGLLQFNLL